MHTDQYSRHTWGLEKKLKTADFTLEGELTDTTASHHSKPDRKVTKTCFPPHRGHCLKQHPLEHHHCKYEEVRITALESRHVWTRDVIHHPMTAGSADVRSHSTPGLSCLCFSLYVTLMFSSTDVLSFLQYYCYHYLTCSRLLREADKEEHGQHLKLNSAQMWHWWSGFHTSPNCLYRTSCPGLLKMPCLRRQSPVISHLNNTIGKANSLLGLFISEMREALKPVIMRLCLFA